MLKAIITELNEKGILETREIVLEINNEIKEESKEEISEESVKPSRKVRKSKT